MPPSVIQYANSNLTYANFDMNNFDWQKYEQNQNDVTKVCLEYKEETLNNDLPLDSNLCNILQNRFCTYTWGRQIGQKSL